MHNILILHEVRFNPYEVALPEVDLTQHKMTLCCVRLYLLDIQVANEACILVFRTILCTSHEVTLCKVAFIQSDFKQGS